jgi:hypothetical protein
MNELEIDIWNRKMKNSKTCNFKINGKPVKHSWVSKGVLELNKPKHGIYEIFRCSVCNVGFGEYIEPLEYEVIE